MQMRQVNVVEFHKVHVSIEIFIIDSPVNTGQIFKKSYSVLHDFTSPRESFLPTFNVDLRYAV